MKICPGRWTPDEGRGEEILHGSYVGVTEGNSVQSPICTHDVVNLLDEVVGYAQTVLK